MIELNKIYTEECVQFMKKHLPDKCIDATITSPPYDTMRKYNGYIFKFEELAQELYRVTKDGGVVVWVVGDETINGDESGTSFRQALYFKQIGFKLYDTMIYKKTGNNYHSTTRYNQIFEYMFILTKGNPKTFNPIKDMPKKWQGSWGRGSNRQKDGTLLERDRPGNYAAKSGKASIMTCPHCNQEFLPDDAEKNYGYKIRDNIWTIVNALQMAHSDTYAKLHPATFPEKLANDHILTWTNPGDVILDPMCGSGTTCKMAMKNKRNFIGIEISKEYSNIACQRLEKYGKELNN